MKQSLREYFVVAAILGAVLLWAAGLPLATVVWDYSRVPSLEAEYNQITTAMSEEEVCAILGPPFFSQKEMVERDSFINTAKRGKQRLLVTRHAWQLNHYTAVYLEFDQHGVLVYQSTPAQLGPRFPTLTNIWDSIKSLYAE